MSKAGKRVKSGSGGGGAKWEQALLAAPFDEVWKMLFITKTSCCDNQWLFIAEKTFI